MVDITLSDKQMEPAVVHTNQFENGVYKLRFIIADYMQNSVDLRKFKAFVVTSINGHMDITEVPYTVSGRTMTLTWDVTSWTLKTYGIIQYQIRFSESTEDGTAVWYSYKGILVNRISINADDYVSANYPTLLKQWIDRINQLSGHYDAEITYMQPGASIDVTERLAGRLYYQIENTTTYEGHFEDHNAQRLGEFNAKYKSSIDINTMLEHGWYVCTVGSSSNMPIPCTFCYLRVTDSGSTNQILQEVYIPENGIIRTFTRNILNGGSTFGEWRELASVEYTNAMLKDKECEINALKAIVEYDLTDVFIETFETPDALTIIPAGYDSRLHRIKTTDSTDIIFRPISVSGKSKLWFNIGFENASSYDPSFEYSFDNGSTWEYMSLATTDFGSVANLIKNSTIMVKISLSGSVTLTYVAFGFK